VFWWWRNQLLHTICGGLYRRWLPSWMWFEPWSWKVVWRGLHIHFWLRVWLVHSDEFRCESFHDILL
jgi:hypothetical protein